jgi:hypothetical protein
MSEEIEPNIIFQYKLEVTQLNPWEYQLLIV